MVSSISIISALATSSEAISTGIASDEVRHIYNELKVLIQQKWTGEPSAQDLISKYELDPEAWRQVLARKLEKLGITQDRHIIKKAEELLKEINISGIFVQKVKLKINFCKDTTSHLLPPSPYEEPRETVELEVEGAGEKFKTNVSGERSLDAVIKEALGIIGVEMQLGINPIELEVELNKGTGEKLKINISSEQELNAAIKATQDLINVGKILFDVPDQMDVGISKTVSIRITKNLTDDFFEELRYIQAVKVEDIRVSQCMAASLRGNDFKIEAFGNEEQIIEDNYFTQWEWEVVPLKGGNRKLWASITIKVKIGNEQALKTLPVLEKEISVKINPFYSITTFVTQHWQWLIASATIPIVGLLLKK